MRRMTTFGGRWWVLALILGFGQLRPAGAIYLNEDQTISLRTRIYSQAAIRLEDSGVQTVPTTKIGQLVQHRNFFNPELEAKLTSRTTWMRNTFLSFLAPDDFSARLAGWMFYDGIYDYGSQQFDRSRKLINSTFPNFAQRPRRAWFFEGPGYNPNGRTIDEIFPGKEVQNPHDIYATQKRINELYFNYTKGPLFLRVGRQAISWGESDTIALLDQNNPFDVTLAAPGLFEDVDESRIPLWTVRSSYALFDTLGPLTSGFIEGYWVPGDLDVNTGTLPLVTASPYSPGGTDPQQQIPQIIPGVPVIPAQFVLLDHVPRKRFENSRWGVRLQTVVARTHTVSAWYYTHFPTGVVPRGGGLANFDERNPDNTIKLCTDPTRANTCIFTTETVHRMTGVAGFADTFFLEPLDGIVRAEAEYFIDEPAFTPEKNLSIKNGGRLTDPITIPGTVPRANFLRWELGFDRFFFARWLNPTNSFVWVTAVVGSWNLDETPQKDFRYNGQLKIEFARKRPGTSPTPDDFVQLKPVEVFGQTHFQTDYLHGRLTPGITLIGNVRGTYAVNPTLTYRWTDSVLFDLNVIHIGGEYQQLGFFRDRDQVSTRVTFQLN